MRNLGLEPAIKFVNWSDLYHPVRVILYTGTGWHNYRRSLPIVPKQIFFLAWFRKNRKKKQSLFC